MSCDASAIRYLLWTLGMLGIVLLLFIERHSFEKTGSPGGFFCFARRQRVSIWAAIQVGFIFDCPPFQLLRRIPQWPTHVFGFIRAVDLEPGRLRRKCSMQTSLAPAAMGLHYGRIPCVYRRIPTV